MILIHDLKKGILFKLPISTRMLTIVLNTHQSKVFFLTLCGNPSMYIYIYLSKSHPLWLTLNVLETVMNTSVRNLCVNVNLFFTISLSASIRRRRRGRRRTGRICPTVVWQISSWSILVRTLSSKLKYLKFRELLF